MKIGIKRQSDTLDSLFVLFSSSKTLDFLHQMMYEFYSQFGFFQLPLEYVDSLADSRAFFKSLLLLPDTFRQKVDRLNLTGSSNRFRSGKGKSDDY